MPNKIQIRRGVKSAMPQGSAGEPIWTIDTEELYISTGQSNVKIGGFSLYMGTDMTATTNDWPYSYVDCPEVKLGDMYLNTDRGFIYMCTTAGKGAAAMWTYQGCLAAVGNAKNHPTGLNSIAMGEENNASGKWSVAMGKSNTADYEAAISIGLNNKNGTARSVVMGNYNKTNLYVIRKTDAKAMLIEVCFVDTPSDVELYKQIGPLKLAMSICGAITHKDVPMETENEESEDDEMTNAEFERRLKALEDKVGQSHEKYDYVDNNMPAWVKGDVQWALDRDILVGNDGKLGLSPIKLWTIAIIVRTARYIGKHMNMKL